MPKRDRTGLGLDGLNFFVANVQTGFGPFIASYLASEAWSQGQIGLALSIGTVCFMVAQVPCGAMVDAARNKQTPAIFAVIAIILAALLLAADPHRIWVWVAEVLHSVASCVLSPAIAAISLVACRVTGQPFGERLGRNARFASIGSGIAAGLMGAAGYWISPGFVFVLAALMAVPALAAIRVIPRGSSAKQPDSHRPAKNVFTDRRLLVFALCCAGFHLANGAMFPIAAVQVTKQVGSTGSLVIAACLIVPQLLVAALSPTVGRFADRFGRRPVLIAGFAAVPLRGLLFAVSVHPVPVVVIQALDGVSGAVFGVMLPLVIADLTAGSGRFNLAMGAAGLFIGGGAALGTAIAGFVADRYGIPAAFALLSGIGMAAVAVLWAFLPETRSGALAGIPQESRSLVH